MNAKNRASLPILVGIDGSQSSYAALQWAASQAKMSATPLRCVATWQYPSSYDWSELLPTEMDFKAAAERVLKDCVDAVRAADPSLEITAEVIEGHPATVLADLTNSSSLVVVGSRGHGEFVGMLLGSVSAFLATHAHCPVVIVRHQDDESSSHGSEPMPED